MTAFAEEPETVLTVYTQNGWGEPVPAKSYTAADLAGLAETGRQVYIYSSKEELKAAVATEYVTLDALLKDAGVSFGEEDSLRFDCDDGPYIAWAPTFEELAQRRLDDEGNIVPAAFALNWHRGALRDGIAAILENAKGRGIRFVCGLTEDEAKTSIVSGKRLPSGIVSVTVVTHGPALSVYTQNGGDEPVEAKSYSMEELSGLAETGTAAYTYIGTADHKTRSVVTTEYVTLDALLKDADVSFAEGDRLWFTCDDGPYLFWAPTFGELKEHSVNEQGDTVPTAFALRWNRGAPGDSTAAVAAAVLKSGRTRFVCGMTGEEAMGNYGLGTRLPAGVVAVTIVSPASAEKPAQN